VPTYRTKDEGHTFRRKNQWLPCIIAARTDEMTEEEFARAMRATWWADNITNSQWPVVLGHDGASKSERSRLKRKMVGWLMALGRIVTFAERNGGLWVQARRETMRLYLEQTGEPHPLFFTRYNQPDEPTCPPELLQ
jgi:hypothetical protein